MPLDGIENRFIKAIQESYDMYIEHGPRSNMKTKVLHGWVKEEIADMLEGDYIVQGLDLHDSTEEQVQGMYYPKNVDVSVSRDDSIIGVISIKFVNSNYKQNAVNYFENQMGETANLRRNNIIFGHLLCMTEPIPYFRRDKSIKGYESIRDADVKKYNDLSKDHLHPHAPDVQGICVVKLDMTTKKIIGWCKKSDLPNLSMENFEIIQNQMNVRRFFEIFTSSVKNKYRQLM